MRKLILLLLLTLLAQPVKAQPVVSDLMGLGMPGPLANILGQGRWDQDLEFRDASATLTREIRMGTSDADDDATLEICGGGSCVADGSRGAIIIAGGNESTGAADLNLYAGNASGSSVFVRALASDGTVDFQTGGAAFGTFMSDGDVEFDTTGDIGWAVVAGANTACNTTCTFGCVFGVNTASATADIVDCADATADECLCAGPS